MHYPNTEQEHTMSDQAKSEPTALRDMPTLRTSTEITDVNRLVATCERLLRDREDAKLKEQSAYEAAQLAITDQFRSRAAAAMRERDDAMRALDKAHDTKMADIEHAITKLKAVRDA